MVDKIEEGRRQGKIDEMLASHEKRLSRLEWAVLLVLVGMSSVSASLLLNSAGLMP